jgi:hypothetical protein
VVNWTNEVVESVYRAEAPKIPSDPGMPERRDWRRTRFAVRAGREHLDEQHRQILQLPCWHRYRLWRTWELKEQLRDLYRSTDPVEARAYLKPWCTAATRSRIASKSGSPNHPDWDHNLQAEPHVRVQVRGDVLGSNGGQPPFPVRPPRWKLTRTAAVVAAPPKAARVAWLGSRLLRPTTSPRPVRQVRYLPQPGSETA